MASILPSHVVEAIDAFFGSNRNEIDQGAVTEAHRANVHALLQMLDEVPNELIDLGSVDYRELASCRAALATALVRWNIGGTSPVGAVVGRDAVERVRRLMAKCRDEVPMPETELPFIEEADVRLGIEDRLNAAWTDFAAREWMGATVFAASALEALLLWALKTRRSAGQAPVDSKNLSELIRIAAAENTIEKTTESQALLAKDARNLIHPGRAARSGATFSKATALVSLAAVHHVIEDLTKRS
jgi:hypothetical protein